MSSSSYFDFICCYRAKDSELKVAPESTPEKTDDLKVPRKMTYAEITKSGWFQCFRVDLTSRQCLYTH